MKYYRVTRKVIFTVICVTLCTISEWVLIASGERLITGIMVMTNTTNYDIIVKIGRKTRITINVL